MEINKYYKNYKDLCIGMDIPICTGNAKIKQLRELEERYEIQRDGRSFTIIRTKENVVPSVRKAHNTKYVDFVQHILLSYLSQQDKEVAYLTQQHLWGILGLVNDYYLSAKKDPGALLKLDSEMTLFDVASFFQRTGMKFRDILRSSLSSLKRRKLIISEETYRIGILTKNHTIIYHDASDDEKRYILRVQRNLLTSMGYNDEFELFCSKDKDTFYQKLKDTLQSSRGWDIVYSCYKIIFNKSCVLEEIDANAEKYKLNCTVLEVLDKQADDFYAKKNAAVCSSTEFFYYDSYPRKQKILSQELIKL